MTDLELALYYKCCLEERKTRLLVYGELSQRELECLRSTEEAQGDSEESWADRRQPWLVITCPRTSQEDSFRDRLCSQVQKGPGVVLFRWQRTEILKRWKNLGDVWLTVLSQYPTLLFLVIHLSCGQISMFSCPVSTFSLEYEVCRARSRFAWFAST